MSAAAGDPRAVLAERGVRVCANFHMGRCGSTVLQKMLNKRGDITADSEIYGVFAQQLKAGGSDDAESFTSERILRLTQKPKPGKLYLFEVKFFSALDLRYFDGDIGAYLDWLSEQYGVRDAITMRRRNTLRRLVSTRIAVARGRYFDEQGTAIELPRVSLPLDAMSFGQLKCGLVELIEAIDAEYEALEKALAARGWTTLPIVYEDDIEADPRRAYDKVCRHFGLPERPMEPLQARINTAPLAETVTNIDAVAEALAGTRHAWMLEADPAAPATLPARTGTT